LPYLWDSIIHRKIMSLQLLKLINNGNSGPFSQWINEHPDPRIAWYPAAGTDFAPLFYLSEQFYTENPELFAKGVSVPREPEIFILTDCDDYRDPQGIGFLKIETQDKPGLKMPLQRPGKMGTLRKFAYAENHTANAILSAGEGIRHEGSHIVFELIETPEILSPIIALQNEHAEFAHLGIGWFFKLKVHAKNMEPFIQNVLYLMADNRVFCSQLLIPQSAKISHLWWQESQGARFPWLAYTVDYFQTKFVFTKTGMGYDSNGEGGHIEGFPNSIPIEKIVDFESFRVLFETAVANPDPYLWRQARNGWYAKD
jgi:hypothetical protein